MSMNNYKVFEDFSLEYAVSNEVIEKYKGILPPQLIKAWQEYGFGSMLNGYYKLINPDEYIELLRETYLLDDTAIPIMTTGMGDIITWEQGEFLRLVNYRRGWCRGIYSTFKFFFQYADELKKKKEIVIWILKIWFLMMNLKLNREKFASIVEVNQKTLLGGMKINA